MMQSTTTKFMTTALFVFCLTTESSAYVSTAGNKPSPRMPQNTFKDRGVTAPQPIADVDTIAETAPWRIALNIGNKPGYFSSTSWPIITKCDFTKDGKEIVPQDDNIRYTIQTGQVVKPITKGQWSLEKNRNLAFTLAFPEEMSRNEQTIKAGTTIRCEGILYTASDLQELNDNFYNARDKTWELGGQLNDIDNQRDGPKKWSEETQQWEKTNPLAQPLAYMSKRIQHAKLQRIQEQENAKRPDVKTLSSFSGDFPGLSDKVFIGNKGVVKQGTQVIGTWSAEPIVVDRPVSYMR